MSRGTGETDERRRRRLRGLGTGGSDKQKLEPLSSSASKYSK